MNEQYNPDFHHRHSIRLPDYNYSHAGAYFVTICTWQREHLFGDIVNQTMNLSQFGEIVQIHWQNLTKHYSYLILDLFIIMPNHIHGILRLSEEKIDHKRHGLPEIIRGFKTFSARQINKKRHLKGVPVWQRNYYEHIIRDEKSLNSLREYIINNPLNWSKDELNPQN